MHLLFRVLNDYDIACNPLMNGLASKKLIYDLTLSYLESNEKEFMQGLSDIEKEHYCRENMMKYINTHQHKLKKMIDKRGNQITNNLFGATYCDIESWAYLLYYLSTLNSHLSSGSRIYTDWISTTKEFNSIFKYYKNQTTHKVAILGTGSGGIMDIDTLVVDLSSREIIDDSLMMLNKKIKDGSVKDFIEKVKQSSYTFIDVLENDIFERTNDKFVGFNYSVFDNETCIYRFYPSEKVLAVLEAIQIDLLVCKMFNKDFFMLDKDKQVLELDKLKEVLKKLIIKQNDPYMFYVFRELYLENKNIDIISNDKFDIEKIKYNRGKILRLARNVHNIQIKR